MSVVFISYLKIKWIKFVIIDLSKVNDGFSSRLRIISYFLAVALIKNLHRKVFIYEKKTKECPFLFTNLFTIKKFKIFKLKKKPYSEIVFTPYNYSNSINLLKNKYNIQKNQSKRFNEISDLSYKYFIPNLKVRNKIKKIGLPKKFVGIHIRATDRELNLKNFIKKIQFREMIFDFHTNHMIENILNFINFKKLNKNVFICSDDVHYKKKIIKQHISKLNVFFHKSKFDKKKTRQTNGIDFITELICLSKSQTIISNVGGNVINTAYLLSDKKIKIYKWIDLLNLFIIFKFLVVLIFRIKKIKNFIIKFIFKITK